MLFKTALIYHGFGTVIANRPFGLSISAQFFINIPGDSICSRTSPPMIMSNLSRSGERVMSATITLYPCSRRHFTSSSKISTPTHRAAWRLNWPCNQSGLVAAARVCSTTPTSRTDLPATSPQRKATRSTISLPVRAFEIATRRNSSIFGSFGFSDKSRHNRIRMLLLLIVLWYMDDFCITTWPYSRLFIRRYATTALRHAPDENARQPQSLRIICAEVADLSSIGESLWSSRTG